MKVLAHPMRQRILQELARDREATSTSLAGRLGVTTGSTSYNLRVLADHGFVEEIPGRGNGRERWWRPVEQDLRFPRHSEQSEAMRAAFREMTALRLADDQEALGRFLQHRDELGAWSDALPFSRGTVRLTLTELEQFFEEYLALLAKYAARTREEAGREDERDVLAYFLAFPDVPAE
jgi:DNA-binding MarR family transcriptional regulator